MPGGLDLERALHRPLLADRGAEREDDRHPDAVDLPVPLEDPGRERPRGCERPERAALGDRSPGVVDRRRSNRVAGVGLECPHAVPRGTAGPQSALDGITRGHRGHAGDGATRNAATEIPALGSALLLPSLGVRDSTASLAAPLWAALVPVRPVRGAVRQQGCAHRRPPSHSGPPRRPRRRCEPAGSSSLVHTATSHRMEMVDPLLYPMALVRRVSLADLQLHRICAVSRQRSSRSGSPSISDPAASRRFHSNT